MIFFSSSKKLKRYKSRRVKPHHRLEVPVTGRQEQIAGFEQEKLQRSKVLLVGAGGINGEVGEGLVRKGMGQILILDDDKVELSNLNRQLFFSRDLYKPKAFCLARNLAKSGFVGSEVVGCNQTFQEAIATGMELSPDVVVCGVDNDYARIVVARYFYDKETPVLFLGTSLDANQGYVFVQQSGQACFCCVFPNSKPDVYDQIHCAPSSKDILKVIAGFALKAVDSLVMEKMFLGWNFRKVVLNGIDADLTLRVERRPDCFMCNYGGKERSQ
jgi:molybdopterin/thiamine biosynthesis adenylyltransferase